MRRIRFLQGQELADSRRQQEDVMSDVCAPLDQNIRLIEQACRDLGTAPPHRDYDFTHELVCFVTCSAFV